MQDINENLSQIKVLIPTDKEFSLYKEELEALYKQNQEKINDPNSFYFIHTCTLFYAFIFDNNLIGAIYYFIENGKLFLNAFSKRKTFFLNLKCLQLSLTWFNCPIYAEAQNRASALCLLRCGFKRIKGNLFVYTHFPLISSFTRNIVQQS